MRRYESFLDESAQRFPEKIALVIGNRTLTFAEWRDAANRFASALISHGIKKGDRVVIFLDNSLETVVAVFGILKAGAVFSVVNASTKTDKLALILNNCRATALVSHGRLLKHAIPAADQAPSVTARFIVDGVEGSPHWIDFEQALTLASTDAIGVPGISLDLAMVIYTSGSTGRPKGVMMTHENIDAASWSITTYLENVPEDVILCALPLSFDYGLYQVLMGCRVGATVVMEKSFTYPAAVLESMRRWQVTGLPLVPTMATLLIQMDAPSQRSLPHLRYITNTGAALPPTHIERLQQVFPSTKIFSMYGLTECKRCTYLPPEQLLARPTSVGIAIPGTEAYVLNGEGKQVKPGEVGVLYIRGRTVMQGYWENSEETAQMLRPGRYPWEKVLCTGDLFTIDPEGYLYFVGRSDDIIKTRGEKVSPKEIESVLYEIPGVIEAAVIGVPDQILGMALKAVLVLSTESQTSEREVLRHCSQRLESFMVPQTVEFRESLPKTDSGKISRRSIGQHTSL